MSAMIATNAVAKAQPDGYTLLACASGEVAINQHLFKDKMSYNPTRELVPIALIGIVPCVVSRGDENASAQSAGIDCVRKSQSWQVVVFVVRCWQPAAACRRTDEQDGGN